MVEPGSIIAGRFEVERRVSAGGMSAVFRAKDLRGGPEVAIKVLYGRDAGEHRERLYREARILEKLSHPGIVKHVGHGETETGDPYLAMEWIAGETLGKRLARTGLTMGESVRLITRVAETLAVAHSKGIIHRDIKPGNLLLRDQDIDRPALIDFGIARMGLGASAITNTGVMLGTLGYMAPEQARGNKQLDARADVFALGSVLFKCITGLPAFAGDDEIAILAKMLFEAPPRVRDIRKDVPAALDDLLARMLSRDARERPADGGVVAAELAALGPLDTAGTLITRETTTHADVITRGEQRLVSVVAVASHAQAESDEESTIHDGTWKGMESLSGRLRTAILPFGAHLESLANGMIVVTLPGRHSATDQAARAARCVLAMRAAAPNIPMVLATGRAVLEERVPIGDAIDRAIRMLKVHQADDVTALASGKKQPIHIDEVTAGLLDSRFIVKSDGGGLELVSEQASVDAGRMLMGKPTPCVGRERELVMLEGYFAECVADDVARCVLVTAPAGVGKSRLRYELLRTLRHRGDPHEVWTTRGDPMRAGSPFGLLAQIIRSAAGAQDGEPPRVQREKIRARVSRHVAQRDRVRVTQFLAEILGVSLPEEDDVQLRAARHDPILMGDQMRRAFEDWLGAECAAQPVLIVLEDLHWGDLPSVKFVDSALRALADKPLMVLALARPEVKDLFPDIFAERGVQELRLKELSRKASEKLVRQVLGESATNDIVHQVVQTAGGNAFYLEELIRSVSMSWVGVPDRRSSASIRIAEAARGAVDGRPPRSSLAPIMLPETVLTMVQARLEALEPEARRVLRAASVFGQTFWRGGVVALLAGEDSDTHVTAWLDELAVREIVTHRGDQTKFRGEIEYVFRHSFVAEAAYTMLTDKDRTIGHRVAAQWLEKVGESEAVVLAEHLERGGEPKRAITFYRRAAAQALEGNDLAACLQRADSGIACGAEGEVLGRLLLRKAEAHRWRGENLQAKECAEQSLKLLPRGGRRWFLAAGEAVEAAARIGSEADLHRSVDELCDVSSAGELTAPHLVALTRAACVLMQAGNYPSADDLLRTIDAAYEQSKKGDDDPLSVAHVYRTRAYRAHVAGDAASALSLYNVAISNFEQAGDTRAACRHLVSAAAACIELGAYNDAERALRDALSSAEKMGLSAVTASAWHHMGMLLARLGDPRTAVAREDAAIEAFVAQGDRRMEAAARLYRALFLSMDEQLTRAELETVAAIEVAGVTPPLRAYALAVLGRIHLRGSAPDRAEAPAREAMTVLDALGGVEEGESYVRLTFAEALEAAGDHDGACDAIATARVRILERAAMIRDPLWKDSFLERVRENARTLELARQWRIS
ncbi:MAG: protein kinase [Deltaproteobacteria bacterium]|nr:protein kinase [Deltaproteobacteria bacterium]